MLMCQLAMSKVFIILKVLNIEETVREQVCKFVVMECRDFKGGVTVLTLFSEFCSLFS